MIDENDELECLQTTLLHWYIELRNEKIKCIQMKLFGKLLILSHLQINLFMIKSSNLNIYFHFQKVN